MNDKILHKANIFFFKLINVVIYQVPEGSQVEVGQLIAVMVEKGMDWKQAVVPTLTKSAPSAVPSSARPDAKPPSSGQYVLIFLIIHIINLV